MNNLTIIVPYINSNDCLQITQKINLEKANLFMLMDESRIGSDLMFQKMWKQYPLDDIFIMHADMLPLEDSWIDHLLFYVNKYSEAGIFGCKLLYPEVKTKSNNYIIQSAGGRFINDTPDHYGSGLDLATKQLFKNVLEEDIGQYDYVREVAWTTFGGIYIRREVINDVGDFDSQYEWSYNRDVDYCLEARKVGWKIYQIPIPILHYESKDNKILKQNNSELNAKEYRNLQTLRKKWKNSELFRTLNERVN